MFYRKVKLITYENTTILSINSNIMKMQRGNKSKPLAAYVANFVYFIYINYIKHNG